MYNLVIVEDKKEQAEALIALLNGFLQNKRFSVTHIATAAALKEQVSSDKEIDILLMDIHLGSKNENEPEGINLVKKYFPSGCGTEVIYVTGCIEHCTRAYQTDHTYFLSKPVDSQDFYRALEKALANLEAAAKRPLRIEAGDRIVLIPPRKIKYIESDRRKVRIYTEDETIETYAALGKVSKELPSTFVQSHKSFLVNMNHIAEMQKDAIRMSSNELIPISQRRRKDVRERFFAHLGL